MLAKAIFSRRSFVNIMVFVGASLVLSTIDIYFMDWQYWAILGCLMIVQFNNGID